MISVCIPTYNREKYLAETLASVYAQTYKDFEIVVVDDGSTDNTSTMIKKGNYTNLRYYWQKNSGDAAARNKLIKLAKGDYITFLDSDDLLLPDSLEKMLRTFENESEDVIAYGPYIRIDENGNELGKCERKLRSGYISKFLFQTIMIHSCGSMFPRSIFDTNQAFDESLKVCSDYELWLRLSLKYRFVALKEPTFKRRRHPGNLSGSSSQKQLMQLKVLERFYFNLGGDQAVPKNIAMQAICKERYRVAKYSLIENNAEQASSFFKQSFQDHFTIKAFIKWLLLCTKNKFHRVLSQK